MSHVLKRSALLLALVLFSFGTRAQSQVPQLGKNSISEVIKAMTPEEKVNLVIGNGMYMPGVYVPDLMMKDPIGGQARVPGAAGSTYEIPRLGIPSIVLADGPSGINVWYNFKGSIYYATGWPSATLLASTWDAPLMKKVGTQFGAEIKSYGIDVILAPAINIHRDLRNGRNYEYYSEDPVVSGVMSAAMIEGIQSNGVGTSLKHYAANNQETNRQMVNTIVSERALREIYLRGFEIAVKKSQPWTIMTSYNLVNGKYTAESRDLVTDILKKEWGFKGFVVTDWDGGKNHVDILKAGNSLLMPGRPAINEEVLTAVKTGKLTEAALDECVAEILDIVVRTPTFKKLKVTNKPDIEGGALVSKETAEQGIVLLKNDNQTLPLKNGRESIVALYGNSNYDLNGNSKGSCHPAFKISLDEGLARTGITVEQTILDLYKKNINAFMAKFPKKNLIQEYANPTPLPEEYLVEDKALTKAVKNSDIAIVSLSLVTSEGTDRKPEEFYLTDIQKKLIDQISTAYHKVNKKVVVVLNVAGPVDVLQWRDKVDAILFINLPGMEGGYALASILTGKVNPSGKLADTWPKDYKDVPTANNFPGKELKVDGEVPLMGKAVVPSEVVYEEGIYVGYRYFNTFNVKPAFEFGYGLSYTTFSYSPVTLSSTTFVGGMKATVTITNTGKVAGKEVVQLYLSAPAKKLDKPSEELKAFAKTDLLQPGASQTITLTLEPKDLASFVTKKHQWIAEAGQYTVKIGASSLDIKQSSTFNLSKESVVETTGKSAAPQVAIKELKK
jgi:beta-glucosidase